MDTKQNANINFKKDYMHLHFNIKSATKITWHLKGRSPVCTIKCRFKSEGLGHTLKQ